MAKVVRSAGVSRRLLYCSFPTKRAFFLATLARGAEDLARRILPDPASGATAEPSYHRAD